MKRQWSSHLWNLWFNFIESPTNFWLYENIGHQTCLYSNEFNWSCCTI